ncbi:MAG: hypothetical protein AAF204_01955 [Pseudomonadota bacterium]
MKTYLRILAFSAIALTSGVSSAAADVNVWRDPDTKMTVSYADTWAQLNNQNPGDVLTIQAPGANDHAICSVNIADEGRFKIYPVRFSGAIQRMNVSQDYWDAYLGRYNNVVVHEGTDNNGLGRGFASMASVSYETVKGAKMKKRAIGFASHYRNHIYTVECSAEASAYHKWHGQFLSFIKSVDFHQGTNFATSGYYRNFMGDKTLKVRGPHLFEDTYF